jgi:hypothetical protein
LDVERLALDLSHLLVELVLVFEAEKAAGVGGRLTGSGRRMRCGCEYGGGGASFGVMWRD